MNADQYPILTQALLALSKDDLSGAGTEHLTGLVFLLEQATVNVAQALAANERERLDMLRAENARLRAEVEVQGDWKRIAEQRRAEYAALIEDTRVVIGERNALAKVKLAQERELITLRTDRDLLMSELGEANQAMTVMEGG